MPLAMLKKYEEELIRWNRRFAFTSVPDELIYKKLIHPSAWLGEHFGQQNIGLIADFGSGAGIPAIPMAIVDQNNRYLLLESSGKKCGFLRHIIGILGLCNVSLGEGRVTTKNRPAPIDMITSRAAGDLSTVLDILSPCLRHGSSDLPYSACFFKGSDAEEEIAALKSSHPDFICTPMQSADQFSGLEIISVFVPAK